MDTIEDETSARLAARIRLEREGRGWSLADLAARSGVGKATISKIERGDASPTAGVLVRLAAAFDLTLASLLVRAEAGADRLCRAADQPVWRDPATGYLRRGLPWAWALHAIAGNILFAVGMGIYFYSGNVVRPF